MSRVPLAAVSRPAGSALRAPLLHDVARSGWNAFFEMSSEGGKDGKPSKPRGASVTDGKAAVAKARAALIGKSVDDLSKDDCVKAVLCFKCKKPRHGGSDCTARGQTV